MLRGYRDATGQWRPWVRMSDTTVIQHSDRLTLEDRCFIWHYSILDATGGLEIGEGCHIGAWVGIFTHSSHLALRIYGRHYLDVTQDHRVGFRTAPVMVGRYVAIGASSLIMPGVTIGDGAAIMAGSIVQSNVAPFALVGGSPARVLGDMRRFDGRLLRQHPNCDPGTRGGSGTIRRCGRVRRPSQPTGHGIGRSRRAAGQSERPAAAGRRTAGAGDYLPLSSGAGTKV